MFDSIDTRALAELEAGERAFLTVYLHAPGDLRWMERRLRQLEGLLVEHPDEATHLSENRRMLEDYLIEHPLDSGGLFLVACWALDRLDAHRLPLPAEQLPFEPVVCVDSSPYIRPLAELQDEFENFAVIVADNTSAQMYLVVAARPDDSTRTTIRGNIKNHVKKGGWSQQRYERRRDKELHHYSQEVIAELRELERTHSFASIIMVGASETLREIESRLPRDLADRLHRAHTTDISKNQSVLDQEIMDLFRDSERAREEALWISIREASMRGGLASLGAHDVVLALSHGSVQALLVERDATLTGSRCRQCSILSPLEQDTCSACGAQDTFPVDLINECVELAKNTGARVEFTDPEEELRAIGSIAALLRYHSYTGAST